MYYERIDEAKERYRSLASDRGRVYVIHGAPAEISKPDGCKFFQPMELWTYRNLKGFEKRGALPLLHAADRTATTSCGSRTAAAVDALYDLFSEEIIATTKTKKRRSTGSSASCRARIVTHFQYECMRPPTRRSRPIESAHFRTLDTAKVFQPPAVDPEQVRKIFHSVVMSTAGAKALPAQLSIAYPAQARQPHSRRDHDSRAAVAARREGSRRNEAVQPRRHRRGAEGRAALRELSLSLRLSRRRQDGSDRRRARPLPPTRRVPGARQGRRPEWNERGDRRAADHRAGDRPVLRTTGDTARRSRTRLESHAPAIRILPLGDDLLSGMQHIETIVEGDGIVGVEFYLDGRKVMSKRQPPYALDLDFGSVPQVHRIRALALDDKGDDDRRRRSDGEHRQRSVPRAHRLAARGAQAARPYARRDGRQCPRGQAARQRRAVPQRDAHRHALRSAIRSGRRHAGLRKHRLPARRRVAEGRPRTAARRRPGDDQHAAVHGGGERSPRRAADHGPSRRPSDQRPAAGRVQGHRRREAGEGREVRAREQSAALPRPGHRHLGVDAAADVRGAESGLAVLHERDAQRRPRVPRLVRLAAAARSNAGRRASPT